MYCWWATSHSTVLFSWTQPFCMVRRNPKEYCRANTDHSSRDQSFVSADVRKWYKTHCSSNCPAVGLLGVTPLDNLFQALNMPIIHIPIGLQEVRKVPIGTINVMKPCDDRHWCTNRGNGRLPVWHDCCAQVKACKLSWSLRKELNV